MDDDREIPETYTYPTDPVTEPRKGVIEGRKYDGVAAVDLLRAARKGDVLKIKTWGSTTPNPTVTVLGREFGEVKVVAEGGQRYRLWPRYPTDGKAMDRPWVRTEPGNDSAGEIQSITVVERAETGEV